MSSKEEYRYVKLQNSSVTYYVVQTIKYSMFGLRKKWITPDHLKGSSYNKQNWFGTEPEVKRAIEEDILLKTNAIRDKNPTVLDIVYPVNK